MLSFLLAASVVAALDAPASLVADCAEPASPYAIRACAAERLLPQIKATPARRRILVDVGGNEWLGSPKALLDHYLAAGAPFDEAHIFEPNSLDAPPTHNITTIRVHQTAVDVGTRDDKDILQWLRESTVEDDFVALKFDVDNDFSLGPTMEWGFLADLLRRPEALALVDELFIELHFFAPSLNWVHLTHSMKQAFDVLRELRACGLPVHAWP